MLGICSVLTKFTNCFVTIHDDYLPFSPDQVGQATEAGVGVPVPRTIPLLAFCHQFQVPQTEESSHTKAVCKAYVRENPPTK